MLPRLKTSLRCCSRVALLRWVTAALCVASLVANLMLYLANQAAPASLLVLQLVATLGTVVYLGLSAKSISLRPAELAERMLKVQEDERQHLGRELHDDIGQLLTAAKLQLQWLQRRMPDELQGHCNTLRSTLDRAVKNDILEQYRAYLFDKYKVSVNEDLVTRMYARRDDDNL